MNRDEGLCSIEEQMKRVRLASGAENQAELAEFLGVSQSTVSDARRQGKIPADWLLVLLYAKDIHPEWILTGQGPRFIGMTSTDYVDAETARERAENAEALRRLPSKALAEELARRVAVAQMNAFSRRKTLLL